MGSKDYYLLPLCHHTPAPPNFGGALMLEAADDYLSREMKKPRLILYQRISPGLVAYQYWYGDLVADFELRSNVIIDVSPTKDLRKGGAAYPPEDLSIVGECIVHPHTIIPAEGTAPVK